MINEQMSLLAFLNKCKNDTVSQSEMYIFIKQHTNNFDKTAFKYLRNDLNLSVCNIKFNIYIETKNLNIDNLFEFETPNGSIYCYESPRTISSYIKEVFPEIDYFLNASTPRQKIQFVINDIEEKGLNREIFEDDYLGFLKFSDMVESEYKRVTESTPNEIETTLNEINRPNNRVMNYKEITFNEFCDKCIEGSVSNIDMINYIEIISNKFDISYMQCLFQDMNLYIEKLGFEDISGLKERYFTLYSFFCILDKKWNHSLDKRIKEANDERNKENKDICIKTIQANKNNYLDINLLDFLKIVDKEFLDIEIYNYFDKTTSGFNKNKTLLTIKDIEVFKQMVIMESESDGIDIYKKNGWEIPYIEMNLLAEFTPENKEKTILIHNTEEIIKKTNPFATYQIDRIVNLLKTKINNNTINKPPKQALTFAGLFKDVYIKDLPEFKKAIISNGYTKENVNLNVLAKIYYWLFDENYLTKQNDTKALKCFYKEFDVIVYKDTKPDTDKRTVTINNIRSQKPSYDEKKEYKNKLSNAFLKL